MGSAAATKADNAKKNTIMLNNWSMNKCKSAPRFCFNINKWEPKSEFYYFRRLRYLES
ncbi:hypothetical protein KUL118_18870 [Tenacibaculum sp. KUL118]|nr:hypothetical protein KUL118_18870 [Tenacibaculum sp. KUL118]